MRVPTWAASGAVVLSGPPGAGKTTLARSLAARWECGVALHADWFWAAIVQGFIEPWLPEADVQNVTVLRSCAAAAATMAAGGYPVVLEGVIGPWHMDVVTSEFAARRRTTHYVVIRPYEATVVQRAGGRTEDMVSVPGRPALADSGPVRELWQQFSELGADERYVLDLGHADPDEAAAILDAQLNTGRFER